MKTLEVTVPDHWTPELTLAAAQLMNRAVRDGFPVVTSIRATATPEEIRTAYGRIQDMMVASGLAA